jgi:hypothetical protein
MFRLVKWWGFTWAWLNDLVHLPGAESCVSELAADEPWWSGITQKHCILCVLWLPVSDSHPIRFGWLKEWAKCQVLCFLLIHFFSRQVISEIVESCRSHEITDLILVHEHRGQPDGLIVCHLPLGPTAYFGLLNVVSVHVCFIHHDLRRCTTWGVIFGVNFWFHFWAGNTARYKR